MKVVAVTGLHRGDNPQPGGAVIAGLRRRFPDLRIVGLSYDPLESGLYSRSDDRIDAAYLLPYPLAGADALLERLDAIQQRECIDFIVPCLDSEIPNFMDIHDELMDRGIQCMLPTKESFERRSKVGLSAFCRELGISTPQTRSSSDVGRLAQFAEEMGYPVYVKGKFYGAQLVNSVAEFVAAFNEIARVWGTPVLVQQPFIGEEYDIVGLGDGEGKITGHCAIRKMLRTSAGKGFAGVVVDDPALDDLARRVIGALRWNGPFELEFIKVPGKPHTLFEMNPRFPAWVNFPSQIGFNLPGCLMERLLDANQMPLRPCTAGQMFIRHCVDLVGDIADLAKMASAGEWITVPIEAEIEAIQ